MLKFKIVDIEDGENFSKLINEIDSNCVDKTTLDELNNIEKFVCSCHKVIIEYPYYDKDYLSNLYTHLSKKFKNLDKECCRLLFFADNELQEFMGYVTLFPSTTKQHLGKLVIDPKYVLSEEAHLITYDTKVHMSGTEQIINNFAEIKQIDPCVCGHTAIWGIVNFRSHWKEYASKTSSEIEATTPFNWEKESQIDGVSMKQMSELLYCLDCNPISKSAGENNNSVKVIEELFVYIESKIPVLLVSNDFQHAIIGIGYNGFNDPYKYYNIFNEIGCNSNRIFEQIEVKNFESKTEKIELLYSSNLIKELFVNDDNSFPYKKLYRLKGDCNSKTNYRELLLSRISGFIVPMYPRINLNYSDVKLLLKEYLQEFNDTFEFVDLSDKNKAYIPRIFMTSSNTYREYALDCLNNLDISDDGIIEIYELIRELELSRMIWVIELSTFDEFTNEEFSSLIILDSTASSKDEFPFLFLFGKKQLSYYMGKNNINEIISSNQEIIGDSRLSNNEYVTYSTAEYLKECSNKNVVFKRFVNHFKNLNVTGGEQNEI